MKTINQTLSRYSDFGPLVIRVILGTLFVLHGVDKFQNGIGGVEGMFCTWSVPAPAVTAPLVAGLEVVLGAALIFGLFTRLASLGLAVILVGAIIFAKADQGILGGAELDLAYLAGLVSLIVLGSGAVSLDKAAKFEPVKA